MKKLLPIIFAFILFFSFSFFNSVSAQQQVGVLTPSPTPTSGGSNPSGQWQKDEEVTFVGKTAARSNDFLEWTLKNYQWISITPETPTNPLMEFWATIRNIILALLVLFVLAAAFIIIITRGQNLTIMRFIPRFAIIVLLIVFSFAIIRFLYQFFDIIQGFFLRTSDPSGGADRFIGPQDLLYIAFDYQNFIGFRQVGIEFDESAYISLLLVRITAVTYYVMTGILLIRKIILWFFVIISPVFPLLLFFRPLRNTAKIWVGEFFRWLLYAPLFAIFLQGLVVMWRDRIPLSFDFSQVGNQIYPTAINILLGGPGQQIGLNNSVNIRDTFALYVVALLMLWVVILLPWLLLQIFLDYLNNLSLSETPLYQRIVSTNIPFINRPISGGPDTPPTTPPQSPAAAGMARTLPFMNKRQMQIPVKKVTSADNKYDISSRQSVSTTSQNRESTEVLKLANLSVPKMRDIARMEAASITKNQNVLNQKTQITNNLTQISNPASAPVIEREKYTTIKEKLVKMEQSGDPVASSILSASRIGQKIGQGTRMAADTAREKIAVTLSHIARPSSALTPQERQKVQDIRAELLSAQQQGNPLATYILDMSERVNAENIDEQQKTSLIDKVKEKLFTEKEKGNKLADKVLQQDQITTIAQASLPNVNRVQQVSLDEYEEVKNIWKENYTNIEPPAPLDGKTLTKEEWINQDITKIDEAVNLLSSPDQTQVQKGMEMVSDILPFLLIGGFSKAEVVAYLKAKQAAGKEVVSNLEAHRNDEDTLLENKPKETQAAGEMTMSRALANEGEKDDNGPGGSNQNGGNI